MKGRCYAGRYYPNPNDTYRRGGRTYLTPHNSGVIDKSESIPETPTIPKHAIVLTEQMKDDLLFSFNNYYECIEGIQEALGILGIEIEGINNQ
jgi:hypothetical protein